MSEFAKEWVSALERDDKKALAIFICNFLVSDFNFTWTNAAQCTANLIGKCERSVRKWRSELIENNGEFPESKQGRYQRSGVLWSNEDLNEKAKTFVRANAALKR